ncbi:MAG: hypothetical protein R3314_11970 [Longimicrobiales bacterium]|nr:hypothetical protein [Longimicrobiales bacterium]
MTTSRTRPAARLLSIFAVAVSVAACGDGSTREWAGTVDTLATGQVVVRNPATGLWPEGAAWRLTEELRIGTVAGDGPDLFGRITSLTVDGAGRVYVLEGQAQEIRVFDGAGAHVRTFGREGGGPGELARGLRIELGPHGSVWVADPQNNRASVFDTAGRYVEGHSMAGGFTLLPWPGRFDRAGHYYWPVPLRSQTEFRMGLVRYDSTLTPLDTLAVPEDPVEREYFELRQGDDRFARVGVPYTGGFRWLLSPAGTFWGLFTGPYRLFELSSDGDTLRTITREHSPLPVTEDDLARAREDLEWFVQEGGQVDWSRIPSHKPAIEYAFLDDRHHLWVWPVMPVGREGLALDVFDPTGRYLGRVESPVPIAIRPTPVVRDDVMYAVTESELDVPFVVGLRIQRPGSEATEIAGAGR